MTMLAVVGTAYVYTGVWHVPWWVILAAMAGVGIVVTGGVLAVVIFAAKK